MKKVYAFLATVALALTASAAPHFAKQFDKNTVSKVALTEVESVTVSTESPALKGYKVNPKATANKFRASRADEAALPEFAPINRMWALYNGDDAVNNYFTIDFDGDSTVVFSDWFGIFSDITPNGVEGNYSWELEYIGETYIFPNITIPAGTVVFEQATMKTGPQDLCLYYFDAEKGGVYPDLPVQFLVDELGNLEDFYIGLEYFLGYEVSDGKFSGMTFEDSEFMGIRGYMETKLATTTADYSAFEFIGYSEDEPFSFYINYFYDEESSTLVLDNFGMSDFLTPFTLDGEDAFVDGAYYMYPLVNSTTGEAADTAFMVSGTLDGIEFEPIGAGCVGTIDYSVADTAVITVDGIWGGVTEDEYGFLPILLDDELYSLFQDSKVYLWDFNNPALSGINAIAAESDKNAPVEYYNLQGMKVASPAPGQVIIKKQGNKTSKIFVR